MAYPGGWHPHIESAQVLDLSRILGVTRPIHPNSLYFGSLTWRNGYGEEIYKVKYRADLDDTYGQLELTDEAETYSVSLTTTPLHFGGKRWWMNCPFTHKRATKLYHYECLKRFCHRTAIRPLPSYASQRASGIDRIQQRRWAIRRKLGDPGTLCDPLNKPQWMRWRTFERFQVLDDLFAKQEDAAFLVRFGRFGILG